ERGAGRGRTEALRLSTRHTGAAVLVAAATTIGGLATFLLIPAPLFAEIGAVGALGIALSQASGVMEFLTNGSSVKSLHPGWAAHGGVVAALLARSGMTGPETSLEGRHGLFRQFAADDKAPERFRALIGDIGRKWHLPDAAYKFYPCCHYLHPFIEAAGILAERGVRAEPAAQLRCQTSGHPHAGLRGANRGKRHPRDLHPRGEPRRDGATGRPETGTHHRNAEGKRHIRRRVAGGTGARVSRASQRVQGQPAGPATEHAQQRGAPHLRAGGGSGIPGTGGGGQLEPAGSTADAGTQVTGVPGGVVEPRAVVQCRGPSRSSRRHGVHRNALQLGWQLLRPQQQRHEGEWCSQQRVDA
ncbi:MAG: MmgE/PrpD family protein, partial [Gemmatimonadetes bacterium]|nr:MmgE/PrpD family protein [Gemmatimonadota bacterium]